MGCGNGLERTCLRTFLRLLLERDDGVVPYIMVYDLFM